MRNKPLAALLVLVGTFWGTADGLAGQCVHPHTPAAQIVSRLGQLGYQIQCGSISISTNIQGQCIEGNGTTNPSTCYLAYTLPGRTGGVATQVFQLDDDEAILTIGTLPPPAPYYGYYTYINGRIDPTAPAPTFVQIEAPVGPAMNQRNADPGMHAEAGGSAYQLFSADTAIVTTANMITQSDIVLALAAGYGSYQAQDITYVEKLPVDVMNLGTTAAADQLKTALRLTPFFSPSGQQDAASMLYIQNPPLQIFRISPLVPRINVASATYRLADDPMPRSKVIRGEVEEQTLLRAAGVTNANVALGTIINNVILHHAALGQTLLGMVQPPNGATLQGRSCIAAFENGVALAQQSGTPLVVTNNMLCQDGSPDAAYYGFPATVKFAPGGDIAWVGVNHATVGSATYSNIAIQGPAQYAGVLSNFDLNGSAAPFLGTIPDAARNDFFVADLNESCVAGAPLCLTAPADTAMLLEERAYLAPATATMPAYTDLVPSVWLVFSAPH